MKPRLIFSPGNNKSGHSQKDVDRRNFSYTHSLAQLPSCANCQKVSPPPASAEEKSSRDAQPRHVLPNPALSEGKQPNAPPWRCFFGPNPAFPSALGVICNPATSTERVILSDEERSASDVDICYYFYIPISACTLIRIRSLC